MSPLQVELVSEHASPLAAVGAADAGGQNVHVAALALALARQGAQVVVHTRRDDPDLPEEVEPGPGVLVHHVDAGPPRPLARDDLLPHIGTFSGILEARWRDRPPDLVHAHFWMSGLAACHAARPLDIPVVTTFHALGVVKRRHQGAADTSPPERTLAERRIMRWSDRIVATCSDEVFELRRQGAAADRLHVVPCGVDLEHLRPEGPVAERPSDRRVVLSLGRLVERKGVDDVLRAAALLDGVEVWVAGGPPVDALDADPDVARLRRTAQAVGLGDRVRFLGRADRAEVPRLLRAADVVVCTPWYEPFGMVPLEAMACGRPVVASAVGGLVDTVVDGVTGRLVRPRAPEALAGQLADLLEDPDRAAAMGRAGRERVEGRYGWDAVGRATLAVYRAAIARRSGRDQAAR